MGVINLKFTYVKSKSTIGRNLQLLRFLSSDDYMREVKKNFNTKKNTEQLQLEARQIIDEVVYQSYPEGSYKRTYNALRSVKVGDASNSDIEPNLAIYSDPEVSHSKVGNEGTSYLAYFEFPIRFRSFISPRGEIAPSNYRPFVERWQNMLLDVTPEMGQKALERPIKIRRTQRLK